jgi:diphosphomevalonate decarboxylase
MEALPGRIARIKEALAHKDFIAFGETLEEDSLDMHAVAQSQMPPMVYFTDTTRALLAAVATWRSEGIAVYATVDAGPNVHLICEAKDEVAVRNKVQSFFGVKEILVSSPAEGAHLIVDHLF